MNSAKLGPWTDYNRRYLDQWQFLTTDYYAQLMTAVVAVCLTLINPCCFRIIKSFITWLFSTCFPWIGAQWWGEQSTPPSVSRSDADEDQRPLLQRSGSDYSTMLPPGNRGRKRSKLSPTRLNVPGASSTSGDESEDSVHNSQKTKDRANLSRSQRSALSASPRANSGTDPTQQALETDHNSTLESRKLSPGTASWGDDGVSSASISVERSLESGTTQIERSPRTTAVLNARNLRQKGRTKLRRSQKPIEILNKSDSSRDVFQHFGSWLVHSGSQQWRSPAAYLIAIVTALFGLFVALSVAGVFSAKIQSDKVGLSNSKHCGIWRPDERAGVEVADREYLKSYNEEAEASQYARNCYDSQDHTKTLSCGYFYNQSISFTTMFDQECPFTSQELCLEGLYSAIKFDTGLVDASVLGINDQRPHKFRRVTTCAPVNSSTEHIRESSQAENSTSYKYYYGSTADDCQKTDYTFNSSGTPFDWLVPAYSVSTFQWSSLEPEFAFWDPIPEIRPRNASTLTIMFISSMHIYHVQESADPIFPARQSRHIPCQREPLYYKADPKATVLACADETKLCSPDGRTCWNMTAPVPKGIPCSPAYWLMKWSLLNSDTYSSIRWRLGNALLAQEMVSQSASRPLNPKQWQLEAKQLFATSLARIQYDTRKIALGVDSDQSSYIEETPDEVQGQLCGIYKFKTPQYNNINLKAFIGLILLSFAILVLSLNASTFGHSLEKQEELGMSVDTDESACGNVGSLDQGDGPDPQVDGHPVPENDLPMSSDGQSSTQHHEVSYEPLVIDIICRDCYSLIVGSIGACVWLFTSSAQEKHDQWVKIKKNSRGLATSFQAWVKKRWKSNRPPQTTSKAQVPAPAHAHAHASVQPEISTQSRRHQQQQAAIRA